MMNDQLNIKLKKLTESLKEEQQKVELDLILTYLLN